MLTLICWYCITECNEHHIVFISYYYICSTSVVHLKYNINENDQSETNYLVYFYVYFSMNFSTVYAIYSNKCTTITSHLKGKLNSAYIVQF